MSGKNNVGIVNTGTVNRVGVAVGQVQASNMSKLEHDVILAAVAWKQTSGSPQANLMLWEALERLEAATPEAHAILRNAAARAELARSVEDMERARESARAGRVVDADFAEVDE